ncbi:hypothetical protein GCM10023081_01760 [Arthrobacter ginkgonis]|uniref:MotA/TolQ/ExbB proton channel domain-containing protein n=1 Tax=Arthrobacter ginkgonis TaxID=1630594 RepID=A0ABP7BPD7_9MICC
MTVARADLVNARSLILPFVLVLTAAMLVVQIVIIVEGGVPGLYSGILTGIVALGIAVWVRHWYRTLLRVRFGIAIVHASAFAAVTTSFNLHGLVQVLITSGGQGFEAAAGLLLSTPWFGVTLGMSALWGLGLMVHLLGAILGRGWED